MVNVLPPDRRRRPTVDAARPSTPFDHRRRPFADWSESLSGLTEIGRTGDSAMLC
jgi:hypothetical protein